MKQLYQVESVLASSRSNQLSVPRDVMDVISEQVCSSLEIPEIIERLNALGYQARYEPRSHTENEIASLWVMIGEEEMLLNCQMESLAVH
ncbi:hypothetical protein [Raoultella terrigena]|uniref:hypothetical protein n=1 Tax=Raoultella terrigena TaxID=577 RepID=UPI000B139E71|nr:hypothetical protein [Raoultella terrigena]